MFGMEHIFPKFLKHFHCMPEMMGKEDFPELKKDFLELCQSPPNKLGGLFREEQE